MYTNVNELISKLLEIRILPVRKPDIFLHEEREKEKKF